MIGVIADDFTGATDVAVAFRGAGLRTAIVFSVSGDNAPPEADVVVVALKTRTSEPSHAVSQSMRAAQWLRGLGARQLYFKICSTFDSTARGNIGPVADALGALMNARTTVVVPSTPHHERRQAFGHLFVGMQLLSDSSMRHHPLTPMTDSYIPAVLQPQTAHAVGLIDIRTVGQGTTELARSIDSARANDERYVVVDALTDGDLDVIAECVIEAPLVVGAAGLAAAMGRMLARGRSVTMPPGTTLDGDSSRTVALAGSCSARTLEQIEHFSQHSPSYRLDALAVPDAAQLARHALEWFDALLPESPALVFSSLPPDQLRAVQTELGADRASTILEQSLAEIARGLVDRGVRKLVVAGGESSGAVVEALGIHVALIGGEVAPGVAWVHNVGDPAVSLILKSGNFGEVDLLTSSTGSTRAL